MRNVGLRASVRPISRGAARRGPSQSNEIGKGERLRPPLLLLDKPAMTEAREQDGEPLQEVTAGRRDSNISNSSDGGSGAGSTITIISSPFAFPPPPFSLSLSLSLSLCFLSSTRTYVLAYVRT